MGSLGRDLAFWLFLASSAAAVICPLGKFSVLPPVAFAALLFWHFLVERPRAVRESAGRGLKIVALVRLWPPVAWLHLLLLGWKGKTGIKAYEIHVPGYAGPGAATLFAEDLRLIEETFPRPALYFWETPVPVPALVRRLIREKEKAGKASWVKGCSPVPKAPTCGFPRGQRAHVRRGAMLLD